MEIITDKERWDELEKSLIEIDDELLLISEQRNLIVDKNYHNWPSRSLTWKTDDMIERKLEIALDVNLKSFEIRGYAWYDDSNGQRFIKIMDIIHNVQPPLKSKFSNLILLNMGIINHIKKEEMKAV